MLGIVVALPDECRSLSREPAQVAESLQLVPEVLVRVAGVGPSRALAAAEFLYQAGACAVLSWGCAAALQPGLMPGTLLLPQSFLFRGRDDPAGRPYIADPNWWSSLHRLLANLNPFTGPLAGSEQILTTPACKQALHLATGAFAADMESAFLARWAAERRLPFAALRAIADTATTVVPKAVLAADDGQGGISLPRLAYRMLRHPNQLKELIALSRQFHAAHTCLSQAAERLLPQCFGLWDRGKS